jgi:hypothetical protein
MAFRAAASRAFEALGRERAAGRGFHC